ncbi:hypothetical protein CHS0354_021229 [Potamilus streckersoni]|uniref:C-type lectin domain-containing protein n=1 Tax=Potamilus streckersoni TaxID=2493646 RepID=A0AAE0W1S4_9BIVA|nr:hypothetical protein CHS0354_021229 [Potamilus streckersoni]
MSTCIYLFILDLLLMMASCATKSIENDDDNSLMDVDNEESTDLKMLDRILSDSSCNSDDKCPCVKPQCIGSGKCPAGYSSHPDEKFCYKFYNECKTWAEARQVCRRDGGDLISLKTINFAFFKELSKQQTGVCSLPTVWVGLSDISVEGQWYWLNGEKVSTTFWAPNEPNNLGEEDCGCLEHWTSYNLNDRKCTDSFRFICQIC